MRGERNFYVYVSIIVLFVILFINLYISFSCMFSELYNVDVLLRLGGPPRISLLTAGYPGLFISFWKKNNNTNKSNVVSCYRCSSLLFSEP